MLAMGKKPIIPRVVCNLFRLDRRNVEVRVKQNNNDGNSTMFDTEDSDFSGQQYGSGTIVNVGCVNSSDSNFMSANSTINETWLDYDQTCANPSSEDFLTSVVFHVIIYIMYSVVFMVALAGNGLVCYVVQSSPRMQTATNYFMANLAVGDILMTLFCVPFSFVSMLVLRYWPFGGALCKLVNYSQAVSVLVSAYTLLALSVDRYLAIMRPLRPRLPASAARLVVAAVWIGALATAAPILLVSRLEKPTEWHKYCDADMCMEKWEYPGQSEQYTCALMTLQFVLPLTALVCTYGRIAHAVWGGRPPGEAHDARDSRMQQSKRKMIKMMVTVVAVFIVCWLPLNIFIILWTIHQDNMVWATWPGMPYVWFACHWLAMSHSCYNPIIYCYMNTRYRRGFKQALSRILPVKFDTPTRSSQHSSACEGVPMSEVIGVNGVTRRGTNSSTISRFHVTSQSRDSSIRRVGVVRTSTAPVRALSVHFT